MKTQIKTKEELHEVVRITFQGILSTLQRLNARTILSFKAAHLFNQLRKVTATNKIMESLIGNAYDFTQDAIVSLGRMRAKWIDLKESSQNLAETTKQEVFKVELSKYEFLMEAEFETLNKTAHEFRELIESIEFEEKQEMIDDLRLIEFTYYKDLVKGWKYLFTKNY